MHDLRAVKPAPASSVSALPAPSWTWPIVLGAGATVLLHLPVLRENLLWVALAASFGLTGGFCGLLPAWLALRKDPNPGLRSGFAVAFIAVGSGALLLALATLWQGFAIAPEQLAAWRDELLANEQSPALVDQFLGRLRGGEGDSWVVLAATFMAFGGGMAGAVVAALRARSRAKAAR